MSPAAPLRDGTEKLNVRLLGGLHVRVDGEPLEVLRSALARSLLAFLVLRADVTLPGKTGVEFWPDSLESQAPTNLRNLLHTLRH